MDFKSFVDNLIEKRPPQLDDINKHASYSCTRLIIRAIESGASPADAGRTSALISRVRATCKYTETAPIEQIFEEAPGIKMFITLALVDGPRSSFYGLVPHEKYQDRIKGITELLTSFAFAYIYIWLHDHADLAEEIAEHAFGGEPIALEHNAYNLKFVGANDAHLSVCAYYRDAAGELITPGE